MRSLFYTLLDYVKGHLIFVPFPRVLILPALRKHPHVWSCLKEFLIVFLIPPCKNSIRIKRSQSIHMLFHASVVVLPYLFHFRINALEHVIKPSGDTVRHIGPPTFFFGKQRSDIKGNRFSSCELHKRPSYNKHNAE